jgi:hypothetical protein
VTGRPTIARVEWLPGSDRLRGRCSCGVEAIGEDPVLLWEWLLAHPDHPAGGPGVPPPVQLPPPPAHLVAAPSVRVPALV